MGLRSNNKVWKKDETASLIALYESEPCLYNRKHPGFHDVAKQNKAYERIHEIMLRVRPDCSVNGIKSRISSLQKQYSDELYHKTASIEAGSCTESTYKPGMWCFELLQFLDPHLSPKNDSVQDKEKSEEVKTNGEISDLRSSRQDFRNSHPKNSSENLPAEVLDDYTSSNHVEERTKQKIVVKRRKVTTRTTSTSPLKEVPKKDKFVDPIDREEIFGQYVASEMKNLKENPLLYLQTKQTILEILTSANFELIHPE